MKQIFFATENKSKIKRFESKLLKYNVKIVSIDDIDNKIEIEESGKDAVENAIIKAKAYSKIINIPILAMDDSLYIENIPKEKQPGTHVRRVNGKKLDDDEMIAYYSKLAEKYGESGKLTCRWVYGIAIINKDKVATYTWNKNDFYIVDTPSTKISPGYPLNSVSINKKLNKYFIDMTDEDKKITNEDESDVVDFIVKNL